MMRPAIAVALTAILFASCNKDNVIDGPDGPVTPDDKPLFRPADAGSSPRVSRVFDYTPAPGQFVNESMTAADMASPEAAASWALSRLDRGLYVSLGAFGGYIVAGFDHSIAASADGGYDFAVAGNAFTNSSGTGGSNEPGVVYVMVDTNGNGMPDDTWYELRGSDHDDPATVPACTITYRRPEAKASAVEWTDSEGGSGSVDYMGMFHGQDSYYPAWVSEPELTFTCRRLPARNTCNPANGQWEVAPSLSGYADNMGSDCVALDGLPQCNRFRIADAVDADGRPAGLEFIDFVKVQTAVCGKSGMLGELSTEVCSIVDLSMLR